MVQEVQPRRDVVTPQQVLLARLTEFCRAKPPEGSLWGFLDQKLAEIEAGVRALKQAQLAAYQDWFLDKLGRGDVCEEDLVDLKSVLEAYLSPGDYADVAIHLDAGTLADPKRRAWATQIIKAAKASPLTAGGSRAQLLVSEIGGRVGLEALETTLTRKPKTPLRKRMALRRLRRNAAEYCSVLHFPSSPLDTFRPFLLLRVEALSAACRRFLGLCR